MSLLLGAIQQTLADSMTNSRLPSHDIYIPDCVVPAEAYARCSHLGVGAHQDDLEFMAFHGISSCYKQDDLWFGGVTCTNGGGSSRSGKYANTSDEAMQAVRISEQRKAAQIGQYSFICQLGHNSAQCKKRKDREALVEQLENILLKVQPEVLYTHNPADKHPTHVAICQATIEAVHRVPPLSKPKKVYGCEVWRSLDWLADEDKIALDVSGHPALAKELNACFDSQIAGGKNYSDAVIGRRHANASFYKSHSVDSVDQIWYAMDLTEPCHDDSIDLKDFVLRKVRVLQDSIAASLD
ncbi:MAG: PIG-L family deacetylase [Verrucomicrobiota bacterium]|nr:PIG-L family deacetylase [Verrucomicrobiota bacterium]